MTWEILEAALKSAAVAAVALLALRLASGRPAAERAWIAHVGLLMALAAPALSLFGPEWKVPTLWIPGEAVLPDAPFQGATFAAAPAPEAVFLERPAMRGPAVPPSLVAVFAYAAVAAALLAGLIAGVARLLVLQHRAAVLTDQPWLSALAHAQKRMGFKHGAALLVSDELTSPVSWGFFRPTILLSRDAVGSPDQAEAIIAHELAHVVRLDWANLLLTRVGAALLWFNPLVWMLARQAHQLREEAADDAVLRGDVPAPDYASLLLGAARHESRGVLLAANGVAPGKDSLKRRLVRVLDAGVSREPAKPLWRAAASIATLALVTPLAAFTPVAMIGPVALAGSDDAVVLSIEAVNALPDADTARAAAASAATALADAAAAPRPEVRPESLDDDAPSPPTRSATLASQAARPSPETLTAMRIHGVTPEWVASLEPYAPEIRRLSGDEIVSLKVHRVNARWLKDLAEAGYNGLTYDQLVSFAIHGVDADYVRELAALGYRNVSPDDLVSMKVHGVDADYVRGMEAQGFRPTAGDPRVRRRLANPVTPQPPQPPPPPPGS